MYKCPRCRRVDECRLIVNKNYYQNSYDIVDLADVADYIGLADPETVGRHLESRGFLVLEVGRNDA